MSQVTTVVGQPDFSGGINAVTSPYLLTKKQIARCRNMLLDEHGSLSTRDGYSIISRSPDGINPIIYHDVLTKTDGTAHPFAIQNDGNDNVFYDMAATPWRRVVGMNSYITPQTAVVTDKLVIANGYQVPLTWDGGTNLVPVTATGGQTVPTGAKHLAFHLGSLWLWNTNSVTTSLDGSSALRMSDVNNVNSWPSANQTFVSKDDGQVGMGMSTYTIVETGISPTATLVLFKNRSAYQFTGVLGSTVASLQRIKTDMGCIAPRTIQFCSGFGIIRLTHKGFSLYNGVDDKIISEEVRPFILGHDDILGCNFGSIERSWAVQGQNPPLYVAACPIGGTGLSRVFVFDLVRRAWTICDFPVEISSLTLYATPTSQPAVRAGTTTHGWIISLFAGDTTDNGAAIDWSFRTRSFFVRSFMQPTFWRRGIIDAQITGPQPVTMTSTLGGIAQTPSSTKTYLPLADAGATYGTGVYGTSQYSVGSVTDQRQSFDIMRTAPNLFVDVNGIGNVRIRGIEFHIVSKKPTKMEVKV
jgi:hypothetical protein